MIRIAITPVAFEAIPATLPLGSVGYEPQTNAKGERLIWLAMRGPARATATSSCGWIKMEASGRVLSASSMIV
jgi:hypothetical protein